MSDTVKLSLTEKFIHYEKNLIPLLNNPFLSNLKVDYYSLFLKVM